MNHRKRISSSNLNWSIRLLEIRHKRSGFKQRPSRLPGNIVPRLPHWKT
jgi:hypothetical protein